jgi:flagellar basal-body rod protein FlgB
MPHAAPFPVKGIKCLTGFADTTIMNVTDSHFDFLAKMLDLTSLRHRVIAQNVANVNTPGYHRLEVSFEEEMAKRLAAGGSGMSGLQGEVREARGGVARADGNNVDVDAELGRLDKNALLYNAYTQILASKLARMRTAITGQ